ncbi:SCO family protein [Haloferula sp. A504]|uniref:SCO family protein n=1 Tax=Haloferula sp. A504 TaxID=3373601 RepID=UPI0031BCCF33|nr:SCO family protein [Verrucomicrobiaceae bacterium E54]
MKSKVVAIYAFVVVASVAMVAFFIKVAGTVPETPVAIDVGREVPETLFPIEADLEMTRQDGEPVRLSDLKGKVTVLAQFFAVCPKCAIRNGRDLLELYETFGDDPDFRMLCISVDPDTDGVEELAAYAETLGADASNWWFTRTDDQAEIHRFLEEELRFFKIRERTDEVDIASNGRYAHDLDLLLIDKEMNVAGKYPLASAASEEGRKVDATRYEREKHELYERIRKELGK